jgi:Tol biopolymer transport system component
MRRIVWSTLALTSSIVVGGCLHAPMPWSPDGKWIAYTVEVRPIERVIRPGWLFEPITTPMATQSGSSRPLAYRIWATRKDSGASVLLEESNLPLTAPGWSPDGRALAFGRLVSQPEGPGRFEVVILEGPTRRRIVVSRPLVEITAEAAKLPGQAIAWSPDGRFLAIPQLNPLGLAIIRADNGRQVNAINDAFLPSWSPDGARLAFYIRGTGDTLNCIDSPLGQPRMLLEVGQGSQAPAWTRDGLTLVVAARKSIPKGADPPGDQVDLIRLRVDTGQSETIRSLATDAVLGRDRSVEGVSIAFDGENLFCSTVVEGSPHVITWYQPRENTVFKKFPILDFSAPMGSLSVSPDGSTLAARVGAIDHLNAPALCDLESQDLRSRLIAPDDASRVEWIATLVTAARSILAALPTASADPKSPSSTQLDRPTLLPIFGEFDFNSEPMSRLRRIGRMGRPLCERPASASTPEPAVAAIFDEARLFFDYLSENYSAAMKAVDVLEARLEVPEQRASLLSVRAQIYLAQGQFDRARETISFLRSLGRRPSSRIEWDGAGYTLTAVEPPRGEGPGWPDYLAWRASKAKDLLRDDGPEVHFNPDGLKANFGLDPFGPRLNPVFPDRPFFNDPIPPQDPGHRPIAPPRIRMPNR